MREAARTLAAVCAGVVGCMLVMVLASGCGSLSIDPRGRTVPSKSRISLPQAGESSGTWANEDLTVVYTWVRSQSQLRISGSIRFADRITKGYHTIQYFHLDALPVDAEGKVLAMVGLTSAAAINTIFGYSLDFNTTLTLPSSAESIAFSYRGRAYGTNDGGIMDFWEYPVY